MQWQSAHAQRFANGTVTGTLLSAGSLSGGGEVWSGHETKDWANGKSVVAAILVSQSHTHFLPGEGLV